MGVKLVEFALKCWGYRKFPYFIATEHTEFSEKIGKSILLNPSVVSVAKWFGELL
jgi:hypothetical protein